MSQEIAGLKKTIEDKNKSIAELKAKLDAKAEHNVSSPIKRCTTFLILYIIVLVSYLVSGLFEVHVLTFHPLSGRRWYFTSKAVRS